MPKNSEIPLISTTTELEKACNECKKHDFITIDTEFIRERTYYPQLCLIQIATTQSEYLIDPLSNELSLEPLFSLLEDSTTLKVFHAAGQDIEIFYHLTGKAPHPVFDTQIAAMACGYGDSISYDKLAQQSLDISIDKTNRFTDWAQRPLSHKQIHYALSDVTHLIKIYEHLNTSIQEHNREHWINDEIEKLIDITKYQNPEDRAWKKIRIPNRSPNYLKRMKYLAAWREKKAQANNVPKGVITKDHNLMIVAASNPKSVEELQNIQRIPEPLKKAKNAQEIITTLKEANAAPLTDDLIDDSSKQIESKHGPLIALLKILLKAKAQEHNTSEKILATKHDISVIASTPISELGKSSCDVLKGWRYDIFGKDAIALKEGKIQLSICPKTNTIKISPTV